MLLFDGLLLLFFSQHTLASDVNSLSSANAPRWQARPALPPKSSQESAGMPASSLFPYQLLNVSSVAEQTTYLHCKNSGKEGEKLEWRRDNQLLPANHRQYVFPNGTLAIQKVDGRLDSGTYTCKLDRANGPLLQLEYHLLVIIPPRVEPITFPSDLSPGARVRMSCVVSRGDPPIKIDWYKNTQLLTLEAAAKQNILIQDVDEFASFLAISSLATQHAGNYSCLARNGIAQDIKSARLTVNVPVYWISEPTDASVIHRTELRMPCSANGNPAPVMEWKKVITGSLGNYAPVTTPRSKTLQNGTLLIQNIQREDEGSYLCQASNGIGPAISKVVRVSVKAPPYFPKDDETISTSLGSSASLTCYANGDLPISVTWFHKDLSLQDSSSRRFSWLSQGMPDGFNSILTIAAAKREDSGLYLCKAVNEFGIKNKTIQFLVQERPETPLNVALVAQNSRMAQISWTAGYDGNSAVINFILEWKSSADLWTDDGVKREYTPGNISEYTVTNLKPDSQYHIRVRASNLLGQSEPSQIVTVLTDEEAPSEVPRDVIADSISSTSISLTWKPPANGHNGKLLGYIIGYKLRNSTDGFIYKTVKSDGKRDEIVKLKDLRKYSPYVIIIQAHNKMGSGPKLQLPEVWTMQDVPSEAPSSISARALSPQRVSITWEQLPQESINGILLGYKVFYKPLIEWTAQPDVEIVHDNTCVLDGLKKFTNYTINVLAYTKMGDGISSSTIHVQTLQDVPSEPAEIKAMTKSSNSILVTWTDPREKNGIIKFFNVYVRSENSKREKKRLVYPNVNLHQLEFSDLTPNEHYEFWVTAETEVGEGLPSERIRQSAQSSGRARIASFSEIVSRPVGSTAVLPCLAVGSPSPSLEWIRDGKRLEDGDDAETLTNGSWSIKRIQPSDAGNYTCKVSNLYGTDFIHLTLFVQQRPLPPVISVTSASSNTLNLEWFVPNDRGSTVTEFTLYYRPETGTMKSISLPANHNSYKLQQLICGQLYHVYMTAKNHIGTSDQSLPVTSRTHGQAPVAPDLQSFLLPNSSSVITFLSAWRHGGCHIKFFGMKYQAFQENPEWKNVADVIPGDTESLTVDDLSPETTYILKVTAANEAGVTEKDYHFSTLTESGDVIPVLLQNEKSVRQFHDDAGNVWLIVGGVLVVIILTIGAGVYWKKRGPQKFLPIDRECNLRHDVTNETLNFSRERSPKKSSAVQSPWKTIRQYSDQNNHSPVSLASTPKQWQPPLRIENELSSSKYGSPKRLNVSRPRPLTNHFEMSHYQTPSNRPLVRDESTPDSGFSGSNVKHTDCDTFHRTSVPRLSTGSTSDSDAQATHKLNFAFHKSRPKPAPRRRPPTRPRHMGTASLQRVAKVNSSSSSPSSTEDLPKRLPTRPRRQPQIHFPSPPHSDDEGMTYQPAVQYNPEAINIQRFSYIVNGSNGCCLEDLVDEPYQPTTTV